MDAPLSRLSYSPAFVKLAHPAPPRRRTGRVQLSLVPRPRTIAAAVYRRGADCARRACVRHLVRVASLSPSVVCCAIVGALVADPHGGMRAGHVSPAAAPVDEGADCGARHGESWPDSEGERGGRFAHPARADRFSKAFSISSIRRSVSVPA